MVLQSEKKASTTDTELTKLLQIINCLINGGFECKSPTHRLQSYIQQSYRC